MTPGGLHPSICRSARFSGQMLQRSYFYSAIMTGNDRKENNDAPKDRKNRERSGRKSILNRHLPLEEESAVFILVNFADVVLTGLAFRFGAREANIAANWVLDRFGLIGMVVYKFVLVTFVLLVCQYIHPTHPRTARAVLLVGSVAYGFLVVYITAMLFANFIMGG